MTDPAAGIGVLAALIGRRRCAGHARTALAMYDS